MSVYRCYLVASLLLIQNREIIISVAQYIVKQSFVWAIIEILIPFYCLSSIRFNAICNIAMLSLVAECFLYFLLRLRACASLAVSLPEKISLCQANLSCNLCSSSIFFICSFNIGMTLVRIYILGDIAAILDNKPRLCAMLA